MVGMNGIYPIVGENYELGCGFFLGRYFLTSAHVIDYCEKPSIKLGDEKINLEDPVFYEWSEKNSEGYDLAIFEIHGYDNGLDLYEGEISPGLYLTSKSYKLSDLGIQPLECKVIVTDYVEGNYFGGLSSINLKTGSSGSPVIDGDKVVGIMTAGNNDDYDDQMNHGLPLNFCVFLSYRAIRKILDNLHS